MNRLLWLAVLLQLVLIFGLMFLTGWSRTRAVRLRQVRLRDVALGQDAWPDKVRQIGNCFNNNLQMPLLFLLAALTAHVLGAVTPLLLYSAYGFVALRYVHAVIMTTSNYVPRRFAAFFASTLCLLAMWTCVLVQALSASRM